MIGNIFGALKGKIGSMLTGAAAGAAVAGSAKDDVQAKTDNLEGIIKTLRANSLSTPAYNMADVKGPPALTRSADVTKGYKAPSITMNDVGLNSDIKRILSTPSNIITDTNIRPLFHVTVSNTDSKNLITIVNENFRKVADKNKEIVAEIQKKNQEIKDLEINILEKNREAFEKTTLFQKESMGKVVSEVGNIGRELYGIKQVLKVTDIDLEKLKNELGVLQANYENQTIADRTESVMGPGMFGGAKEKLGGLLSNLLSGASNLKAAGMGALGGLASAPASMAAGLGTKAIVGTLGVGSAVTALSRKLTDQDLEELGSVDEIRRYWENNGFGYKQQFMFKGPYTDPNARAKAEEWLQKVEKARGKSWGTAKPGASDKQEWLVNRLTPEGFREPYNNSKGAKAPSLPDIMQTPFAYPGTKPVAAAPKPTNTTALTAALDRGEGDEHFINWITGPSPTFRTPPYGPGSWSAATGDFAGAGVGGSGGSFNPGAGGKSGGRMSLGGPRMTTNEAGGSPGGKNPSGRGGISGGGGGFSTPVPDKLGGTWLGGSTKGLPVAMVDVLKDSAKYLPAGYSAKLMSGVSSRPGGSKSYHPHGLAADVQIFDEKGRKLDWYQNKETFRIYEAYAQSAKKLQTDRYPKENFSWGGYFWNKGPGSYGFADSMHMQWGGPMGGGDWERGANAKMRAWLGDEGTSVGMGKLDEFKLPETTADLKLGRPTAPAAPGTGTDSAGNAAARAQVEAGAKTVGGPVTNASTESRAFGNISSMGSKEKPATQVEGNRIEPVSFARSFGQKVTDAGLVGTVPTWGPSVGITTGSLEEWQRFGTSLIKQESGMRTAQVNPDGSLQKFGSTKRGESSYGPGQFNKGEYGLNTWEDVNNPDKVGDALIRTIQKNKTDKYFGPFVRNKPGEYTQHFGWYDKNVSPALAGQVVTPSSQESVTGNVTGVTPSALEQAGGPKNPGAQLNSDEAWRQWGERNIPGFSYYSDYMHPKRFKESTHDPAKDYPVQPTSPRQTPFTGIPKPEPSIMPPGIPRNGRSYNPNASVPGFNTLNEPTKGFSVPTPGLQFEKNKDYNPYVSAPDTIGDVKPGGWYQKGGSYYPMPGYGVNQGQQKLGKYPGKPKPAVSEKVTPQTPIDRATGARGGAIPGGGISSTRPVTPVKPAPRASIGPKPRPSQAKKEFDSSAEKEKAARGGAYGGGHIKQERTPEENKRREREEETRIKPPFNESGVDNNMPGPGDGGTGEAMNQVCFV